MALNGKAKRWTTIIMTVAGTLSGLTILTVETCSAIRRAEREAEQVEKKAQNGYEALAPAVQELQTLIVRLNAWGTEVDEAREKLQAQIHEFEVTLARHEAYFEMLKQRYHRLEGAPEAAVMTKAEKPPPVQKLGIRRPTSAVPDTLKQAQRRAE